MIRSAEQIRGYTGPAILSYGFRPFFLAGGLWAGLVIALWLPFLSGNLVLPTMLSPVDWHLHELVYGYVPAVIAGFLFTAVPNWTGRLPITGRPLLLLFLTWIAGRVAIMFSGVIGLGVAAAIDMVFITALVAIIGREVAAGKNKRNLKVVAVVGLLLIGNALFHLEIMVAKGTNYGVRLGVAATVLLIMIIGGRIIPSFTHNWLARQGSGRMPQQFSQFDGIVMMASGVALLCWVAAPAFVATGLISLVAAGLNIARLSRWCGNRTLGEPLVFVLHVAYAFVPLGFLLVGIAALVPGALNAAGAMHAWTVGSVGLTTLAVMTRASLGHTGRPLVATAPIQLLYISVFVAAVARVAAAFDVGREPLLYVSAAAWVLAFFGFAVVYWPVLTRPRA